MSELSNLVNIGKVLEEKLIEVGISTPDALDAIGSEEAWLRIQEIDSGACLHMLQALEGAIQRIPKKELTEAERKRLNQFAKDHHV